MCFSVFLFICNIWNWVKKRNISYNKQNLIFSRMNLLVIVSLLRYEKTRQNPATPFMISLCLLDLVYSFFILPIFAAKFAIR